MRIVLEVTSAPAAGKRFWLRSGQTAEIGRSNQAVFSFPDDHWMSSLHFRVECGETHCRLQDLGSRNGTTVNGRKATHAALADGDLIVAGETEFRVHIEGVMPPDRLAPSVPTESLSPLAVAPLPSGPRLRVGHWLCHFIPAGWDVVPGQGMRCTAEGQFPASLMFAETGGHEHLQLREHVNMLIQQYLDALQGCRTDGASDVRIRGTDEARQFLLEHPQRGDIALRQQFICIRQSDSFGMAVFTASQDQLETSALIFDQILSGLSWENDDR